MPLNILDINRKIGRIEYLQPAETTVTLCIMTMTNGFTVVGQSACVNKADFSAALSQEHARTDAINKAFAFERYLARQRAPEEAEKPKVATWAATATASLADLDARDAAPGRASPPISPVAVASWLLGGGHTVLANRDIAEIRRACVGFLSSSCHGAARNAGWWNDPVTGEKSDRNVGELIALVHSELSEALEGFRKNKTDEHLPEYRSIEVELADALIRIFDMAGGMGLRIAPAFADKMDYNARRADHKPESRAADGGKKF